MIVNINGVQLSFNKHGQGEPILFLSTTLKEGKDLLKRIFKNSSKVELKDCGHMVPFEGEEGVAETVLNFIKEG